MKQTAMQQHIEWLKSTIEIAEEQSPILVNALKLCLNDATQRLEMEKEQIIHAWREGDNDSMYEPRELDQQAEQYYNKQYGMRVVNLK